MARDGWVMQVTDGDQVGVGDTGMRRSRTSASDN